MTVLDRSDPGVRAAARFDATRRNYELAHTGVALACLFAAIVTPFVAYPLTGDSGATVGAVVAAVVLASLGAAVWPHDWQPAEAEHHRLEAVWRELRPDAEVETPWERYGAWAEPRGGAVELSVITRAPLSERFAGAPSPYGSKVVQRLDPDEVATAAEAMEELRADLAQREFDARQRYEAELSEADRRAHEQRMRRIDEEAAAYERAADERARRELGEQEAAERQAQADALARALRRP